MSRSEWKYSSVFVVAMICWSGSAAADQCDDLRDPDPAIVACTKNINSGKWNGNDQAANYVNRGFAYGNKGDNDSAIADYNQAIALDPKSAMAYNNRCIAYRGKGDTDRAIADCSQAISLDPKFAFPYNNRGLAYGDKGDNERAVADYNQAISLDRKFALAYFNRGRSNVLAGSADKALADITQANALAPRDAGAALWLDIVSRWNGLPGRLAQTSSQIDMTVWPAPVIRLFMGQMTIGAVLAAADDPDATRKKNQLCEANFYSAGFLLAKESKDEAIRLFRLAASDCPYSYIERGAASAELKALGVAQ